MMSQTDQLVEDIKTLIEIIQNNINVGLNRSVRLTKEGFEPFLSKFEELANEVSMLETERQRLMDNISKLNIQLQLEQNKIAVLKNERNEFVTDLQSAKTIIKDLQQMNINQAKIIMQQKEKVWDVYDETEQTKTYALDA